MITNGSNRATIIKAVGKEAAGVHHLKVKEKIEINEKVRREKVKTKEKAKVRKAKASHMMAMHMLQTMETRRALSA